MSDETNTDFPSSADRAVDSLHRIDEKVNRLREDRLNDPDSLGDKLIKSGSPSAGRLGCRQSIPDDMGQGHEQTQSAQGTGGRRAARSGNESGIRRRFGRTRRSGFAAVGSGLQGVRRPPPSQVQPLIPRLDDGFCWLTDGSSLDFRQGTISQSTGTISPAQFRHTISAFHCEVIHRGVRRLPCDNKTMVTNATIEALLGRRSIRKFKDEAIDDDTRATLETVAQHAASSQFLNDWSAIRIIDPAIKAKLAEFGHQPYIATAPVAVRVRYRRAPQRAHRRTQGHRSRFRRIPSEVQLSLHPSSERRSAGPARHGDRRLFAGTGLRDSRLSAQQHPRPYRRAESAGIHVSGAGSGHRQARSEPDRQAAHAAHDAVLREHLPGADADGVLDQLPAFDEEVHRYYDLRQADRPVDAFSDQVATISRQDVSHQTLLDKAAAQGFRLDQ